jgi:hypothetical protein
MAAPGGALTMLNPAIQNMAQQPQVLWTPQRSASMYTQASSVTHAP